MCTALRGSDHQASKRGIIGEGEHRPGFLHFPKKPFVAKAARCDLSTVQVQVVVHTYRLHFCLGPHAPPIILIALEFATADSTGLPLVGPASAATAATAKTQVMKKTSRRIFDIPFSISLPREVSKIPPLVSFLPCQSSSEYRSGICRTPIESFQAIQDCRAGYRAPGENEVSHFGQNRFWIYRLRRR